MSNDYPDFSELEREFELDMEGPAEADFKADGASGYQLEFDEDEEILDEFETYSEEDRKGPDDFEVAFERYDTNREQEVYGDQRQSEFVDRFLEISSRQFESSYEADAVMGEVLDDIEREYLFGSIRRGLKSLSKNKLLRSLAKKGMTVGVNKFFPGLQGALQLARGNVKGALLNFGKQALGSVVPGGGAMLDAVKSIGLEPAGEGNSAERETWENYVNLSREAYEHLAENLTPHADQPAEAVRLANNAVQHAIAKAKVRASRSGRPRGTRHGRGNVVCLRISPGERLKLIIVGA